MEVKDIKLVLLQAKERQETHPQEGGDEAIKAVEAWLREIGALPPR